MSAVIIFRDDSDWFMNVTAFTDLMAACVQLSSGPITATFETALANNGLVLLRTDSSEYREILDVLSKAILIAQNHWGELLNGKLPEYTKSLWSELIFADFVISAQWELFPWRV